MVVFVACVKHPLDSKSYRTVWELLNNTLLSVCNQTDRNFKVVVVCNEILPLLHNSELIIPHTEFVKVDFPRPGMAGRRNLCRLGNLSPPPGDETWEEKGQFSEQLIVPRMNIRIDKGTKILTGLLAAEKYHPDYIVLLDADDFVLKDLVEYIHKHKGGDGWIMSHGYRMLKKSLTPIYKEDSFCGTGNTILFEHLTKKIPLSLSVGSSQEDIISETETEFLLMALGAHRHVKTYFQKHSILLDEFPFRGVVHLLGTGENVSDVRNFSKKFKRNTEWKRASKELKAQYNIKSLKTGFLSNLLRF